MKWFERYAAKRVPHRKSSTGFTWKFFDFWRLHVMLVVKTHSRTESRQCEIPSLAYVLQGKYLEHRLNGQRDTGDWMYTDSEGQWVVHEVLQGRLRAWEVGEKQRIELFPAERLVDRLLDMPEWMTANEVEFNTEKQVWLLLFGWYKEPPL